MSLKLLRSLLVLVTCLALTAFLNLATPVAHAASAWVNVGAADFSAGSAQYTSLAFAGSTPYVAFSDGGNGYKATVMKFDGTNWVTVGAAGFSAGGASYTSLAFAGSTPYVAFTDAANSQKATVMKFDGTNWVLVGAAGFSPGKAYYTSLAFDGSTPYVAFEDGATGYKLTVMKYDGTNWVNVGAAGFSAGIVDFPSLAMDGSTPYVAFTDYNKDQKATVMKFDGTNWVTVGAAGFSPGYAYYNSLAFAGSTPYVAFQDEANGYKATVMKFDGTNWVLVGAAGFSASGVIYTSLALDGSTPYVAYGDQPNGVRATVMRFDGANWVTVGAAGFSPGMAIYTSLALNGSTPYAAFLDQSNLDKATVMKFVDPQAGPNFVVNSAADTDDGSCDNAPLSCTLREAINAANALSGADTITFSVSGSITLTSNLPAITGDLTIDAAGQTITVNGATAYLPFTVNSGKTVTLNALTISNGKCSSCSGGGVLNSGTLNVTNSTFVSNNADYFAGGIMNSGTLNITNSTFRGNGAPAGGAITNAGTMHVTNSTFSGNNAFLGRGILTNGGTTTLKNTIVAEDASGCSNSSGGVTSADAFNLDNDGTCDSATTSAQINLGALANNGGPTQTMALHFGSAAINAGDNIVCTAAVGSPNYGAGSLDQRGITRPQGATCDAGAFEAERTINIDSVSHDEGDAGTTPYDFTVSLNFPAGAGGVTFDVATADDSATTADNDYQTKSLTEQTIPSGSSTYAFTALVNGDTTVEPVETFFVNITNVSGADIEDGQGVGTIVDDDIHPTQSGPNFLVNSSADTDDTLCDLLGQGFYNKDCTLREAINAANALSGDDTITFDIPAADAGCTAANTCTIQLGSQLPNIADTTTLDGSQNSANITILGSVSGGLNRRVFYVNNGKTLSLESLTIANGLAMDSRGGGIFNDNGTLNADHTTFSGNSITCVRSCGILGGAIYNSGTANIANSTFVGNSAAVDGKGGAIYNAAGTVNVTNSTFNGNTAAGNGGAIASSNGTVNVTNSTLSGNSSSGNGGGISNEGATTTTLKNTIIANNTGGDCFNAATLTADAYNLDSDGSCDSAATKTGAEIALGPLASNGGSTQTMALGNSSVAIDAANPTVCADTNTTNNLDQRGKARNDLQCDVGAFEFVNSDGHTVVKDNLTTGETYTFGPTLAQLLLATGNPGIFTVNRELTPPVNTPPANALPVTWDAQDPVAVFSVVVTLCYDPAVLTGQTESTLHVYHYNGTTWDDLGGTLDTASHAPYHCITATTPLTSLSPLALAPVTPTAVSVRALSAKLGKAGNITVRWRTTTEAQIAGFNVYRKNGQGAWKQINTALVPAKHSGDLRGAKYAFKDRDVRAAKTYRYKLEVIYLDQHAEWTDVVKISTP